KEGYKAFYLAIGAQGGRSIGVEGEDAKGVISGIDFLREVNQNPDKEFAGNIVVIGGGNVAIDVARAATRAGAKSVTQFSLESREQMPAALDEIEEAEEENVAICNGWGPKKILVKDGKVCGIELKRCLSVFDDQGRFSPSYDEEDTMVVEADYVLLSVGQSIIWKDLLKGSKVELRRNQTAEADGFTYQTAEDDIFVGGDVYTGPRFAIDAIAAGKEAAVSIHRFVQPGQSLVYGRDRRDYKELDKASALLSGFDRAMRQQPVHKKAMTKEERFHDLRGTFTEEQMKKESQRCLGCGATIVDSYMCVGCGQCTTKCKFDAIHLERVYDGEGVEFMKMKPVVIKQMVKRKGKIAVKKVKKMVGLGD
ncbi:MAG TPA: FAD-dependent oxidoreductase, partial [Lachnospiraceae bacterium]